MNEASKSTPLIELSGVGRQYGQTGKAGIAALSGISLTIGAGEFVCITGPSGSGKSTLLSILGCLDRPTSGSYRFVGREVSRLKPDALAWLRREAFGFVFQSYNLLDSVTTLGNVELPGVYGGLSRAHRQRRAKELLAEVGLAERARHRPAELSGGEQQRASIARALMNGGRVILADEPTGALDQHNGKRILDHLEALAQRGQTVVVVSHSPDVAKRTDRQIELRDGRVLKDVTRRVAAEPVAVYSTVAAGRKGKRKSNAGLIGGLSLGFTTLRRGFFRQGRLRAFLSLGSVALAVWWVVTLGAVLEGIAQEGMRIVNQMDANHIVLMPTTLANNDLAPPAVPLSLQDAENIEQSIPNVRGAAPRLTREMTVQSDSRSMQAFVKAYVPGMSMEESESDSPGLEAGRPITQLDNERLESVALIGPGVHSRLFSSLEDPLGQYLTIDGHPFLVKGIVSADRLNVLGASEEFAARIAAAEENRVYIPFNTGVALLFGTDRIRFLDIWVHDAERIGDTAQAIGDLLIRRHGQVGFMMSHRAGEAAEVAKGRKVVALFVLAIGAIAMLAGGLGVMAVMLMSVTGRTREIGLRMAMGARKKDVLTQFLLESAAVVTAGGVVGLAASVICTAILATLGVPMAHTGWVAIVALASAVSTGLLFGILPARRAASVDPAQAIAAG